MPEWGPFIESLGDEPGGLSAAELLARHPNVAKRTAQRWQTRNAPARGRRHRPSAASSMAIRQISRQRLRAWRTNCPVRTSLIA